MEQGVFNMDRFDLLYVDWNATVAKFFTSVEDVLNANYERLARKTKKSVDFYAEAQEFYRSFYKLHKIAENPRKYADYATRAKEDMLIAPSVFIPYGTQDNTVYLEYMQMMHTLENFYRNEKFEFEQRNLLTAIKKWNYVVSKNKFKDLYFGFLPLKYFAATKQFQK